MRLRSPWLLLFHASGEQTAGAIRLNSSEIWFPTRVIPESLSQGLPGKGLWVLELLALQASSAWRADHFLKGTSKSAKGSWELAVALRHYEQCECVCVCKSMRCVCVCVCSVVFSCGWWDPEGRMREAHSPSAPQAPTVGEPREIGREGLSGHSLCYTVLLSMERSDVWWLLALMEGLPRWCCGEESARQCRRCKRSGFDPWIRKIPLQYSCLGNPRDRAAWWAVVHGVAQRRTCLSYWACQHSADFWGKTRAILGALPIQFTYAHWFNESEVLEKPWELLNKTMRSLKYSEGWDFHPWVHAGHFPSPSLFNPVSNCTLRERAGFC